MANTYEAIATVTVSTSTVASVEFTSIPGTYTDLKLVFSARNGKADTSDNLKITFNGTGGTVYSERQIYGNGSVVESYNRSSQADLRWIQASAANATASTFGNGEMYISNYTSSNNKSASGDYVAETNATGSAITLAAHLFSNSNAITSIQIDGVNADIVQYSTFYLYGIKNS